MTQILNLFCSRFTRKPKMFWICSADLSGNCQVNRGQAMYFWLILTKKVILIILDYLQSSAARRNSWAQRRAKRDKTRARSVRAPKGGSGGPPSKNFENSKANGANLGHPGNFFNTLVSKKLRPFLYSLFTFWSLVWLIDKKRGGAGCF